MDEKCSVKIVGLYVAQTLDKVWYKGLILNLNRILLKSYVH